jgi:hypothetical protein
VWHRAWKDCFDVGWQEKLHFDPETGEKHIADIKTDKGFIIEFQHSAIKPSEMQSRESFYKNMVWVVNGLRLKNDYRHFLKGFAEKKPTIVEGYFRFSCPEETFPANWLASLKPVYFDFQGFDPRLDEISEPLWCLLPGREDQDALVARISREQFIELSSKDPRLLPSRESFSAQVNRIQSIFAEAAEAAAELKKRKELQAAAHQQYLRSLIPRRLMSGRL